MLRIGAAPAVCTALLLIACVESGDETGIADDTGDGVEEGFALPGDTAGDISPAPDCSVVSDLADANYLEGESVRFVVSCSGSLATASASFEADALPTGASFDPGSRTFSWTTGPADGGRFDVTFSVLPVDGSTELPDKGTVTFWVADDPSRSDNVPVTPETYTEEWGLPVVHVATSAVLNTETDAEATVTWYGQSYATGIQIHGKTSSHYPKQSYGLKFTEAELPIAAWDVTRDHLLLISTFDDNSYVRQKFTYDLWAAIADYWGQPRLTPRSFFTVVYLNGHYLGLYVGEDRLDDEWADQLGFERDANLYKAVDPDANYALTDQYGAEKATLHQGYEKAEGDPAEDFSDLDALVEFTGSSTAEEIISGSPDWIDLNEWMDALALLFYVNGEDSYVKNIYLHHAPGELFRYAPWDFNSAWGQNWRTYRVDPSFEDTGALDNRIFAAILSDPEASAWFWSRLDQLCRLGPLREAWQRETLDGYFAAIDRSAQRDWDVWSDQYRAYGDWAEHREDEADWTDYEGEKAYLYEWIAGRAAHFEAAER
ncbi:hypothetical protein LBMAG42_35380 [Deltaproteobacteria bacterium]|nr:hypothetical protein LBMAG42_35380 [Deltaproteobacteria bacterium]